MSIAPNWPPAGISPEEFFDTWLPGEFARVRAAAPDAPTADIVANITLTGDGGGTWSIESKGADVVITAGAHAAPNAVLTLSAEDFAAVVDRDGGLVPPSAGGANVLLAGPLANQAKTVKGQLSFAIDGYKGRRWQATLVLGGATAPAATISVGYDTYQQMLDGSLPAPQAYFTGKILLEGDTAFALQVGMSMMTASAAS